jgi:hypothetical protein
MIALSSLIAATMRKLAAATAAMSWSSRAGEWLAFRKALLEQA